MSKQITCPECGANMALRTTHKFVYNDGRPRKFWGCTRYPKCKATHGAHPDGRPLGTPADTATKIARMEAHRHFDELWQSGRFSRRKAYEILADIFGMTEDQAHIAKFNREQCEKVIEHIDKNYGCQTTAHNLMMG